MDWNKACSLIFLILWQVRLFQETHGGLYLNSKNNRPLGGISIAFLAGLVFPCTTAFPAKLNATTQESILESVEPEPLPECNAAQDLSGRKNNVHDLWKIDLKDLKLGEGPLLAGIITVVKQLSESLSIGKDTVEKWVGKLFDAADSGDDEPVRRQRSKGRKKSRQKAPPASINLEA